MVCSLGKSRAHISFFRVKECAFRSTVVLAGAAIAAHASSARAADDEPAAVPYRPSVSTPAALTAPGWLEIEAGLLHQRAAEGDRRDSLPVTLKLAFTPDWGVRIGADAWVRQREAGVDARSGYGDTGFVLKRRFALDEGSAFGLESGVVFATARHGLGAGSGRTDLGLNAIYSADFASVWHTDINLAASRLGSASDGAGRVQWLGAAAVSRSLGERWGVVGELSGTQQSGSENTRQLLFAASYNVSKRLVLDAGAAHSLRSGAPGWSAFTGFTWLATRLF